MRNIITIYVAVNIPLTVSYINISFLSIMSILNISSNHIYHIIINIQQEITFQFGQANCDGRGHILRTNVGAVRSVDRWL